MERTVRWDASLRVRVAVVLGIALTAVPVGWVVNNTTASIVDPTRAADGLSAGGFLGFFVILGAVVAIANLLSFAILRPLREDVQRISSMDEVDEVVSLSGKMQLFETNVILAHFARTRARASADERARLAFSAAFMHDLKTRLAGLNLILGVSERLSEADASIVRTEVADLQGWLGDTLDALRLDEAERPLARRDVDIRRVVDDAVRRSAGADDQIEVQVHGSVVANVDPNEFGRALLNLISNGRRAARSYVAVEILNGLVRVSDDGPGLPASLDELTQPFKRIGGTGTWSTTSGTGLGLFIARRVLEQHGGRLVCERSDGSGTSILAYFGRAR